MLGRKPADDHDGDDDHENEYVKHPNALETADGELATSWRRPFLVTQLDVQVGEVEHLDNDKINDTNWNINNAKGMSKMNNHPTKTSP